MVTDEITLLVCCSLYGKRQHSNFTMDLPTHIDPQYQHTSRAGLSSGNTAADTIQPGSEIVVVVMGKDILVGCYSSEICMIRSKLYMLRPLPRLWG